jgi:hypothetical protein
MNYERFVIYCLHIETCHVYNITNERLIENKAPIINYDSQQRSKETITWKSVTELDANILRHGSLHLAYCNCVLCMGGKFSCIFWIIRLFGWGDDEKVTKGNEVIVLVFYRFLYRSSVKTRVWCYVTLKCTRDKKNREFARYSLANLTFCSFKCRKWICRIQLAVKNNKLLWLSSLMKKQFADYS